jgi:dUTP pyrophosphatase
MGYMIDLKVKTIYKSKYLDKPFYATVDSAGFDLIAAIHTDWSLAPGCSALVPTGLILEIPKAYFGDVRPRSGLACKQRIIILNAPGTVDRDYRNQVMIGLYNLSSDMYVIKPEDRIAQMIIQPYQQVRFLRDGVLEETERGMKGHGSSGQ